MRVILSLSSEKLPAGLSEVFLRSIIRETCTRALPNMFQTKARGVKIEVAFVSERNIAKLNKEYRGKDMSTDVLSFGEYDSLQAVKREKAKMVNIGTLVLSMPFIRRSAKEDGVSWKQEFVFVFSHGVLHLLGLDHSEHMFSLQDRVTEKLT